MKKAKQTKLKAKAKPKAKVPANTFEKKVSELDRLVPFRVCYVCERDSRDLMRIGPTKFRHQDCNPGSPEWCDYWERIHPKEHTDAGELLYEHAQAKKGGNKL